MYLLDTNICIYAMKGKYPALSEKLLSVHPDEVFLSAITISELEYGACKSRWSEKTRLHMQMFVSSFSVLPFTEEDAVLTGQLRAALAVAGKPVGSYDLMIAAQGISRGLTVVTHNIGEFERVPGIQVVDWVL